jgi:mRNA-degrading endonuclease toxin of MazEF toxin-antitoxin module
MRMNSSNNRPGQIVVADMRYSDDEGSKRRLGLIISSAKYNANSPDIVILKITSKARKNEYDCTLTNASTEKKMLAKESFIRADFPVVIVKEKVLKHVDEIHPTKLEEIKSKIRELY